MNVIRIQNPEQVGTALKTLSLRIRGVKTELEEAGLETEGMAETTSQLQAKLQALTHGKVDILIDTDTFKNTTQILREMADVWEEMTDMEQAAALELLGGKRQANILSSLITNFQTVEDVIESSMNSSGSAMAENAKWLDSIAGKSEQLTNAMQALWNQALDSRVVKHFLDVALVITKVLDKTTLWGAALAGAVGYLKLFKNINFGELGKDILVNINNYKNAIQQVATISSQFKNVGTGILKGDAVVAYANAISGLSEKQQAAILTSQGLSKAQAAQIMMQNGVKESTIAQVLGQEAFNKALILSTTYTEEQIAAIAAKENITISDAIATDLAKASQQGLTAERARDIMISNGMQAENAETIIGLMGLKTATDAASFSFKGLGTAISVAFKSNPLGWIMTAVSLIAMAAPLISKAFKSTEEKLQDLKSEWEELADTINTASNDFATLKSSADDVIPRFSELAKGVDQFGNNVKLTDEEYKEFLSLNNQIADMFPEINNGMDSNGNAMLALSFTANTLEDSLWSLVEAERATANEEIAKTMPDVLDNIGDTVKQYEKEIKLAESELESFEYYYNKILNGETIATSGAKGKAEIENILDALGAKYSIYEDWEGYVPKFTFSFDNSDIQDVKRNYENAISGIDKEIENINTKISKKWSQLNPVITAWAQTDYTYQGLSDEMQRAVQSMIGNIDFSDNNLDTEKKIQSYIKNNIINKVDALTPLAQQKLTQLMNFSADDISVEDYIAKIKQMASDIEEMDIGWTSQEILDTTGFSDIIDDCEDTRNKIVAILGKGVEDSASEMESLMKKVYSLSPSDLTKAFDIVKKYGIKTWNELAEAIENKTFDVVLNYDKEQEGVESLTTAIEESTSAIGLSSESIDALKNRYQDLEGYDPARLFEETTNGIHLNTKALWELEEAYRAQKKTDLDSKLKDLTEQYNDLTVEIGNCTDAAERANLYKQRSNVLDQINDTATLAAQYEGLMSSYNKWQQIQNAGNERDMYEGVITGREEMDEEMSRGWIDDGTRAYLEMLSGKDLSAAPYEEVLKAYKELNQAVNESGYNVYDFFTQDDDGNSTTDGIFNFFDAVKTAQNELGKNWVKVNEEGQYMFDFGEGEDKAVADALGVSEELVQIILRAAKDAGFEVNMDSVYTQLADFKDEVTTVNDRLKELGATDYTFNINSTDIDDVNTQINEARNALAGLKSEDGTLKIGISEEDYQNTQTLLATLIYQKQTLEEPAIMGINVKLENAEEGIQTIIAKLIDFKSKYNDLEVKAAIGADTTESQANLDAAIAALNQEDKTILTSLGIDTTKTSEEINAAIANITPQMMVDCGLDTSLVDEYKESEHTTDGEVIWDNNIDKVTEWMSEPHIVNGTVEWDNDTTKLNTYYTGKGVIYWDEGGGVVNGTAHVSGTAFAGGNWGAPKTETALVGELGPEMLVRNGRWTTVGEDGAEFRQIKKGDIIFNHKQTEQLLSKGYITGRGKAYSSGTAYSDTDGTYGPSRHTITSAYIEGGGADRLSDASDAAEDFAEAIDWIEIRIEELDEDLGKLSAQLENATTTAQKNNKIDEIIAKNKEKMANLDAGADYYEDYAKQFYNQIPSQFKDAAKNGAISITDFEGEASEEVVEAIQNYRDYAQKAADLIQQQEEIKSEITDLAKQKFDNVATSYENRISLIEAENTSLETNLDLQEGQLGASKKSYDKMIKNSKKILSYYEKEADDLQAVLDNEVALGRIKVKSDEWYEMKEAIADVKNQADECRVSIEDLALEKFNLVADDYDKQIGKIENANDKLEAQIGLMENMGYKKVNDAYDDMIANTENMQKNLKKERKELKAIRDAQVKAGNIKVGSEEWYEMEDAIAELDVKIIECTASLEELADSKLDAITNQFDNLNSLVENTNENLQDTLDFQEESGNIQSPKYYVEMMKNTKEIQNNLKKQRDAMQDVLDAEVEAGRIDVGDDNWYEHVNAIADVDAEIRQCTSDLEGFQNSINDIYWDAFDQLINQFEYLSNETQGLIDVMSSSDMFVKPDNIEGWSDKDVQWTDEGLASLGLHAQEMERAEEKAEMYAIAIDDLTKEYKAGNYSESEYKEKLDELTQGQYDAIRAAKDEKDAIVALNKERIDYVKDGIDKQIKAYEKLISKQKEELSAEKDLHDFQKGVADQQKNIAAIERQLAALANDNSMSAVAKRKQLEAELAEAQYELQDTYYNRSVDDKQDALDQELESFQEEKDAEMAALDSYLSDVEAVVADSLGIVKSNAEAIGQTLTDKANEYNLTVSSAVLDPWSKGAAAIDEYTSRFGDGGAISKTISQLDSMKQEWAGIRAEIAAANTEADKYYSAQKAEEEKKKAEEEKKKKEAEAKKKAEEEKKKKEEEEKKKAAEAKKKAEEEAKKKAEAEKKKKAEEEAKKKAAAEAAKKKAEEEKKKKAAAEAAKKKQRTEKEYYGVALAIWNGNYGWGTGTTRKNNLKAKGFDADKVQRIVNQMDDDGYVHNGTWSGKYHGITSLSPYHINKFAKGTLSASKNQLALIDELGEELQIVPNASGRLEYIKKGTGIVPADLTSRLINLAMDPQEMLDRNRPAITPNKNIVNTEINLDCSVGNLVHIEHCDQSTLPDVEKLVNKAFDKHMQNLNNNLKRFTR